MTIHISIPAAPQTAACGDAEAKRFTFWRWKATCVLCKAATAAVGFEQARRTDTVYLAGMPIRYSALVAYVRANGGTEEMLAEFARDKTTAVGVCPLCKADLADPIALLDVNANRMVFACPHCSSPPLRERWEREGRS